MSNGLVTYLFDHSDESSGQRGRIVVDTSIWLQMQLMEVSLMMLLSLSALVLGAGLQMQPQATAAPSPMPVKVTQVMAVLTVKPGIARPDVMKVMPEEVRETVLVYLDGKIDQWYAKGDGKGVVFFLRCTTVEEAKAIMEALPLHKAGYVDMEYIPVGPLAPLRLLIQQAKTSGEGSD